MATFGPYSAICYGLILSAVTVYSVRSWYAPTFNDIADGRPPSVKFCCGHRPRTLRGSICFRMLAYGGPPVFMHRAGKSSSNRFLNFCLARWLAQLLSRSFYSGSSSSRYPLAACPPLGRAKRMGRQKAARAPEP